MSIHVTVRANRFTNIHNPSRQFYELKVAALGRRWVSYLPLPSLGDLEFQDCVQGVAGDLGTGLYYDVLFWVKGG